MVGWNIDNHIKIEGAINRSKFKGGKLDVIDCYSFLPFPFYTENPCYNEGTNPCVNGGKCIVVNDDTYECECDPGYIGANCEDSKIQTIILHYQLYSVIALNDNNN